MTVSPCTRDLQSTVRLVLEALALYPTVPELRGENPKSHKKRKTFAKLGPAPAWPTPESPNPV